MLRSARKNHWAFTLVELLVVIAIIALLISILLPSLARAREQAKKIKCSGNLKDVSAASYTYAQDDPEENVVPHWSTNNWVGHIGQAQWMGPFSEYNWGGKGGNPDVLEGGTSQVRYYTQWNAPNTPNGPGRRPLNKTLYTTIEDTRAASAGEEDIMAAVRVDSRMDLDAFHCPSDRGVSAARDGAGLLLNFGGISVPGGVTLEEDASLYEAYGNSYKAHFLNTFGISIPGVPGLGYSYSAAQRPYSQVGNPSRTILYSEGNAMWTHIWNHQGGWEPLGGDMWAMGWHGDKMVFNASFVDGHAGIMDQNVRMRRPIGTSGSGFLYSENWVLAGCRPEFVVMPHSSAYGLWSEIYRGDGWQLDTFPSPVLPLNWEDMDG